MSGRLDSGSELKTLDSEIVDLLYAQTLSPDSMSTPTSVCKAFSEILLKRWELCCILIYLRGPDGHLRESAMHLSPHLDSSVAHDAGVAFAVAIERARDEVQVWLDEDTAGQNFSNGLRERLMDAGLRACVATPIHASGQLVGALVALSAFPERMRAALGGLRFAAAPIVIAVGIAERCVAMHDQRQRIEHLVEELQQHSGALEEANSELQRVGHYRSLFLARMSHELRTPLTSMLGFTEIMLDQEKLTDAQRRFCEKIQAAGMQLQASLNQLVDLSRLEAGHTELFLHEFSLSETLRESCAAVARLAQKQEVEIDCPPLHDIPSIVSDEGKLRQVLYNFLAHAISRSRAGQKIIGRVECPDKSRFQIIIEDEGEPLRDPAQVFKPIDLKAPSGEAASMNELGLVIARRLIDMLGGSVHLENRDTRGLSATIELPSRPPEKR
ncbi:MAG TPA: HAMP domain-containing sensor histidine kinase [Pyrinomonadaceae bacterium]|nr:HAMP domain-containing sensor histidine kinase [Pyrinomonadaceae bacterium]